MSQRTEKVASLIHQVVASELRQRVQAPEVTVMSVDVSPDMRQAMIWVSVLSRDEATRQELFGQVLGARSELQMAVARSLTAKFAPRLELKLDTSGDYADHINRLIKGI
jgi:ribosome-binding factor A